MRASACVGVGVCVVALNATVLAAPTGFFAQMLLESDDSESQPIDGLFLLNDTPVALGKTEIVLPVDDKFVAPIAVTFAAITAGNQRTVTITYESLESYFVTQPLVDALIAPPEDGYFMLAFQRFFQDADWNGAPAQNNVKLFDDGQVIVESSFGTSNLNSFQHGWQDSVSPGMPGFFGAPGLVDKFVQTVSYGIVPSPATLAPMLGCGILAMRRRRA